ncbi:hypothetical protein QYF36_027168 [Acer negundo]|nr:hypothetical protein QYF36_027168 [Acer negundo]
MYRSPSFLCNMGVAISNCFVTKFIVGGQLSSLESHIDAVKAISLFEGTDFKLVSSHQPLNYKVAHECGFTSLSVLIVKELVTLSSHPLLNPPDISNAGRHLSAVEFNSLLQSAGKLLDEESLTDDKKLVLLDARNLYETRIGKFHTPSVETLDPSIRQYSDLPSWIGENAEQLMLVLVCDSCRVCAIYNPSLSYLKTVFAQQRPFDGILGFSQGAAMAASICALRERPKGELDIRFGILCCGYALPSTEFQPGSINCPSLHIFGSDLGKDRDCKPSQ